MSEPSLSGSPTSASSNKPRHITSPEMRNLLRHMFRENPEASFVWQLREPFRDPIKDGKGGRFRINPIWVQLGILVGLTLATFLYFTYAR